jgi:Na+/H+ antiporter NhaC
MTVLLAGPVEFPWYFYVVAALAILGATALLLLPVTVALALANRREDESAAKLAAKYTLIGVLPAAYVGLQVAEGRYVLLLLLYLGALIIAWSSRTTPATPRRRRGWAGTARR